VTPLKNLNFKDFWKKKTFLTVFIFLLIWTFSLSLVWASTGKSSSEMTETPTQTELNASEGSGNVSPEFIKSEEGSSGEETAVEEGSSETVIEEETSSESDLVTDDSSGSESSSSDNGVSEKESDSDSNGASNSKSFVGAESVDTERTVENSTASETTSKKTHRDGSKEGSSSSDSSNGGVDIACYASLSIEKDITTITPPEDYFEIEKGASPPYQLLYVDETGTVNYTIRVSHFGEESGEYHIEGNIYITNTGDWPADVVSVKDFLQYKKKGESKWTKL
jgi:hypothetical protein